MAKRPIDHKKSAFVNKEVTVDLKIKKMSTEIYDHKKEGIKEILKVAFWNAEKGISITMKGKKATHPLRDWDKRMLNTKETISLKLSLPTIKQTAITDEFKEPEE